jgi:hypothetical protein
VGNDAKVKTGPAGDRSQSSPNPALYVAEMVVSPMTLNLNGEELEGAGIVLSPSMVIMTLQKLDGVEMVLSPRMVTTRSEEMRTHATTLKSPDSDAAACPTTTRTNRVKMNPTNPTTKAG